MKKKIENSSDSLSIYFQKIKNIPVLSTEEERQLIEEAQAGNEKSFSKLIIANQRLVIREALRYYFKKDNLLDLINEGNKGLIEALRRFDLSRDNKFFTYALWWVRSEIRQYLSKNQNLIALPDIFYNDYLKFKKAKFKLSKKLGRSPNIKELSDELDVPEKKIKVLLSVPDEILSLDKGIKDANSPQLSNFIEDKSADNPEDLMQALALKDLIKSDIEKLNEKEEMVIKLRFGFGGNDPQKLRQIAKTMNMSPEGIRRIESKALRKLRQNLKKKGIYGVLN